MINDENVIKYDDDVSKLIDDYNAQIKQAENNAELSDVAFFDMGKKLREVEKKIIADNPAQKTTDTETTAKKVFAAFKKRVSIKINKNISNVDKVYKVADFCETETYQKYQDRLPTSWGTLYLLVSLKDDKKDLDTAKIDKLMSDNAIVKNIKRSELIKKINGLKNPKKVINQKVTITFEGSIEATQEQLKELQEYLNKNKKFKKQKWNVTNLEIIPAPALKSPEDNKTE